MKRSLVLVFALAACGDNSTKPVDDFITAVATAQCSWEFRCCTDPEIKQMDGHKFANMDDCVPYRTLALEDQLFLERLAAKEGRLKVDVDKAQACLDQMNGMTCNPKPGMVVMANPMMMDECVKVLKGTTDVGKECIYVDECVDGARCVGDKEAVGRGVCVPYQQETEICNASDDCDPTQKQLYCAQQDFHCHFRAKLGEKCAYTLDSTGKVATLPLLLECDNSLGNVYCDPVSSTCMQLPSDGEPCLSPPPPGVSSSCDPDPSLMLVCDTSGSTTGTGGVCRAPGKLGQDCHAIQCDKNLYCDTSTATGTPSYTCKALPGFGQNCEVSNYQCMKPYFCDFSMTPYSCNQPLSVGESCAGSASTHCDTTLYCDSTTQTCKPLLPDGSVCTSSNQCISLNCSFGTGTTTQETCQPAPTITPQCSGRT